MNGRRTKLGLLTLPVLPLGLMLLWAARQPNYPRKVEDLLEEPEAGENSRAVSQRESRPWKRPESPPENYVGSRACAECHSDIASSYQNHPMAHSAAKVHQDRPMERDMGKTSFQSQWSRRYRVERTDQGVYHHETGLDAQGNVLYDQAVKVDYVIGSGQRGRSYLIQRDGMFFESPITWYSQKGRWDLSPGYNRPDHRRFERRIADACLHCHTGRVNDDPKAKHRFRKPAILEVSIGCERCHGPGQGHIAYHNASPSRPQEDPIINPADLEPARREAVCNQCHLQGDGRILRYGRSPYDFRPGSRLEEIWAVFVKGTRVEKGRSTKAVSQVEQMRSSLCYQASSGRLGCTSCHDPHSVPAEENKAAFYRSRCLQCHQDQHCSLPLQKRLDSEHGNSCIECHMPKLEANDIPHTAQTDHRILKRPQATSSTPQSENRLVLVAGARKRLTPLQQDRARGLRLSREIAKTGQTGWAWDIERFLRPVLQKAPDDVPVLEALGLACWWQQRTDEAETYWKRALQYDPQRESVLRRLTTLYRKQGRLEKAKEVLQQLLDRNRWRSQYYGRYAHVLGQLGEFSKGIEAAKRGLELNPSLARLHGWLAEVYQRRHQTELSRRHLKRYRALNNRQEE